MHLDTKVMSELVFTLFFSAALLGVVYLCVRYPLAVLAFMCTALLLAALQ